MPRLDLIIGMASLTLCCYATMPPDKGLVETTTQLYVNGTPFHESKCAKPPQIENGILMENWNEETYPQDHKVNYRCHPGYILTGKIQMTCFNGTWLISSGKCKKKLCGNPGDIPFGTFELRNGEELEFGAVVEYSCDEGYQMVSKHKTRICAADGWTNQPPHCEARLCPPVTDDSVIVLSNVNDDEFSMGHVITLKCKNPKQRLKGPSRIYCTANGTWNMDPPTCKESCTTQENDLRKNNIQLKDNQVLHFKDNEDVQFECVSGYNISDPAKLMIQCNSGVLKYPTCHRKGKTRCGRPPHIPHGEIIRPMKNSYRSGSSVEYQCEILYRLQGNNVINCRGGMWDDPPVCLELCFLIEEDMSKNHLTLRWNRNLKKTCFRKHRKSKYPSKCAIKHNDILHFACLPGYIISDLEGLRSKCNRGVLSYPTCFKKDE